MVFVLLASLLSGTTLVLSAVVFIVCWPFFALAVSQFTDTVADAPGASAGVSVRPSGGAVEQELSLRRDGAGLALILNRRRERHLVTLACLVIAGGQSRHDQVRRRFRFDFDGRDIRAAGSGVVLHRQGGEVITSIIVGVLDHRRRLRYIG